MTRDLFADPAPMGTAGPKGTLDRRSLLRLLGVAGVAGTAASTGLGARLLGGTGAGALLGESVADASGICSAGSRLANAFVVSGNLHVVFGLGTADVLHTSDNGASFASTSGLPAGAFQPYSVGTNGVPGSYGIGGDQGWVWIYEAPTTWPRDPP